MNTKPKTTSIKGSFIHNHETFSRRRATALVWKLGRTEGYRSNFRKTSNAPLSWLRSQGFICQYSDIKTQITTSKSALMFRHWEHGTDEAFWLRESGVTFAAEHIRSETESTYAVSPTVSPEQEENEIIAQALEILRNRMNALDDVLTSPDTVRNYLKLHLSDRPYEVFGALWLTNRHAIIDQSDIFRGTIDGASVYPREVLREAIAHNAAAVIFYHNHPSGNPEPSQADIRITEKLKNALSLIDARVLDHVICGGAESVSLAERGLI